MNSREVKQARAELDKIRAFVVSAYEALGGRDFNIAGDSEARDEHRKEAITTVKPLLALAIDYANTLDVSLEELAEGADAGLTVVGGAR